MNGYPWGEIVIVWLLSMFAFVWAVRLEIDRRSKT